MYDMDLFLIQVAMALILSNDSEGSQPDYFLCNLMDTFAITSFFDSKVSLNEVRLSMILVKLFRNKQSLWTTFKHL